MKQRVIKRREDDTLINTVIDMITNLDNNFDSKITHIDQLIYEIKETQVGIKSNQDHFKIRLDKYENRPLFIVKTISILMAIIGVLYGIFSTLHK